MDSMVARPGNSRKIRPPTGQLGAAKPPPEFSGFELGIYREKGKILPEENWWQPVPDYLPRVERKRMDACGIRAPSGRNGRETERDLGAMKGNSSSQFEMPCW